MEPASERNIRSDYTLLYRIQQKTKRGYALDITTLSVFQSIGMIAEYLLERKVCLRIFYFKLISILKNQQESAHFLQNP